MYAKFSGFITILMVIFSTEAGAVKVKLKAFDDFYDKMEKLLKQRKAKFEREKQNGKKFVSETSVDITDMKFSKISDPYKILDSVKLPVSTDFARFNCNDVNMQRAQGRIKGKNYYLDDLKKVIRDTKGFLSNIVYKRWGYNNGNVKILYCIAPNDPEVKKVVNQWHKDWVRHFKRQWAIVPYYVYSEPQPVWTKENIPAYIENHMSFSDRERMLKDNLQTAASMLVSVPDNKELQGYFDKFYSEYFGVSKAVAKYNREHNMLGGKLSGLSKRELYKAAIDELLALNNSVSGNTPKLKYSYLDVYYLLKKVYIPEIKKSQKELELVKCRTNLFGERQKFDEVSAKKAIEDPKHPFNRVCRGSSLKVTGDDILREPFIRIKFIEILARKTGDYDNIMKKAGKIVALQSGNPRVQVSWVNYRAVPGKVKPFISKSQSGFGTIGTDGQIRPKFFNYVYKNIPFKKKTKLQISIAREILAKYGLKGSPTDKKLAKAYKKAKGVKCLKWVVVVARDARGRGRFGKPYRYSNGSPSEISCGKMRRSSKFRRIFKHWNNFFDKVAGGKYKGRWRRVRNVFGVTIRKERNAIVYVKRKI